MSNDTYILKNVYMPIVLVNAVMKWSDEVASSLRQVLQVWSICLCVATNLHNINSIWWLILVKRYIDPMHKWLPIKNSFVSIKIIPTNLAFELIIQKNFYSQTRLVWLI